MLKPIGAVMGWLLLFYKPTQTTTKLCNLWNPRCLLLLRPSTQVHAASAEFISRSTGGLFEKTFILIKMAKRPLDDTFLLLRRTLPTRTTFSHGCPIVVGLKRFFEGDDPPNNKIQRWPRAPSPFHALSTDQLTCLPNATSSRYNMVAAKRRAPPQWN
jgi:hypothetical protein